MKKTKLVNEIFELIKRVETSLPRDVEKKLREAYKRETNELARIQLGEILKNVKFARKNSLPICQDTGLLTFYVRLGDETKITEIERAIKSAIVIATKKIPLRENLVDAINRKPRNSNLGNKQPEINFEFIPNKREIEISLIAKGAGSENMNSYKNLSPNETTEGIKKFILEKVKEKSKNSCPPIILGVGIGGSSEQAMKLAKIALLRKLDEKNKNREIAKLEEEILNEINKLGIGTMGLGGDITCLKVAIETADTHIASLPIAISFGCWAMRRANVRISSNGKVKFS
ncbi:MAG: fumarate hydratase [Candidatus Altiarchaeota archaeon]